MKTLSYDLHIHSCLSPCGDDDMTPANIIGMAQLIGLDVIALTDHNTCKNCGPIMTHGKNAGITVIPGMELTTSEEVHVLCLFPTLEKALAFDSYVYSKLMKIENQEDIFGHQYLYNEDDKQISSEKYLLINATEISFSEVYNLVKSYQGIMIPAHIDKMANSLLSNLGFISEDNCFTCVELKNMSNLHSIQKQHPYVNSCRVITNSDAHGLMQLNEPINTIHVKDNSIPEILKTLETPFNIEEK